MTSNTVFTLGSTTSDETRSATWKDVDRALHGIARRRSVLDAEEARWLRAAARVKIWREIGFVSLLAYLEHRLGYAPRTAHDRVRVALALGELPAMEQALADGMPFSAVRELTRVATPDTEQAWLDACRGKTVHGIEQQVSGRPKGASPTEPARPDLTTRPLTFEDLKPTTLALLRQARAKAQDERGHHLSDDELLALLCGAFLGGNAAEPTVARYQVAVTICKQCNQGWQQGAGREHAMDRSEVERALCDAQHIGTLDNPRARAVQDVPPRIRRFVWRRDGGKCRVPGCRSTASLELHHIHPKALGGTHDPENLITTCDGCHSASHRGLIAITGTSSNLLVERIAFRDDPSARVDRNPSAHVGTSSAQPLHAMQRHSSAERANQSDAALAPPNRFERERIRADARSALQGLGFRTPEAAAAVDHALTVLGPVATLESVIMEALRASAKVKPSKPTREDS